jgi:hypothetical protein
LFELVSLEREDDLDMSEVNYESNIQQLGDQIVGLTLLQAKSLSDYLRTVHGIEPAGVVMGGGARQAEQHRWLPSKRKPSLMSY